MVIGDDETGDGYRSATDYLNRARAALEEMEKRYVDVRGNWAAQEFARERPHNPN